MRVESGDVQEFVSAAGGGTPRELLIPARWSTPDAASCDDQDRPVAFEMLKAMQAEGVERGEDYRGAARHALAEFFEGRMAASIDRHSSASPNAARPTGATAATGAGC